MPDDAIFEGGEGSEGGSGEAASAGEGGGEGGAQPVQIDPQKFEQAMSRVVSPLLQRIEGLERHIDRSQQAPASSAGEGGAKVSGNEGPLGSGDKSTLDRFVEDPDGVLNEHGQRVLKQVAPVLQGVLSEAQERTTVSEKEKIDGRYGEGTFDEKIAPRLEVVLKNAPAAQRGNPQFLRSAVASIRGMDDLADDLEDRRQKKRDAERKAERERTRPPQFVGAGRMVAPQGSDEIGEDSLEFLKGLGRSLQNADFDEDRLKKVRGAPRSYADRVKWAKQNGVPMPGVETEKRA